MANYGGGAPAPKPKRTAKPKRPQAPRYANNEQVKGGTLQRTNRRLKQTGHVKGVNTSDGITGREARLVKRASNRPRPGHTHDGVPRQSKPRLSADERSLRQEVRADTRLAYGPQERELDYRRQQESQFSSNNQSYYAKHVQDMQQAQRDQQVFQQGLLAGQNAAVQQAATTDQNANAGLLQQQQADAAQRGTTVDPSVAQTMQQGVAARQASGVAGTTQLAQQASAQGAYMGNQVQVAGEQGIQAQQDSQARQRKIDELAAQLAADKGAFRVKDRANIQNTRHKSALEDAAFGLDAANTAHDNALADKAEARQGRSARQSAARNRLLNAQTRESIRTSKGKRGLDRNADLADDGKRNYSTNYSEWAQRTRPSKSKGTGPGGPKSNWTHGDRQDFDTALSLLREKSRKHVYTPADRQQVIDALVKKGMTREVARAAWIRFMRQKNRRPSATPRNSDGTPG